ncbi:MAG: hypothetical protein QG673_711, partial [Pseudomonadota bacterium]|nr:hypothetical protein [Pseudomonadota bacterium]
SNGHNVINENNQEETHISSISKVTRDEEQSKPQLDTKSYWGSRYF